jgi:energy-coupling factor transporter ATP-binding protein EcfA2
MAIVTVEHLTYRYPQTTRPALRDISLQIESGEFVALIGANGAGKSTLSYALSGFVPHFYQGEMSGRVTIAGLDTQTHSLEEIVIEAGLVFQNPSNQISGAKYTVYEEVAFGLEQLGVPRDEMRARIDRALALANIADLADRSPFALSGGQQQRLALASIFAMQPKVLVLDEPTSQLDPVGSEQVFAVIRELCRQGITVVMAEHKLEWIAQFADRVIALADGEIILNGKPNDVLTSPLLETHHIAPTRYTRAARQAQQIGLWLADQRLPVTLDQAEVGFRKRLAQ